MALSLSNIYKVAWRKQSGRGSVSVHVNADSVPIARRMVKNMFGVPKSAQKVKLIVKAGGWIPGGLRVVGGRSVYTKKGR